VMESCMFEVILTKIATNQTPETRFLPVLSISVKYVKMQYLRQLSITDDLIGQKLDVQGMRGS
jgi:hypothetical protein